MSHPDGTNVWELVGEDFRTHRRNPLSPGLHALVVHRVGTAIYSSGNALVRFARPLYKLANAFVEAVYGIELPLQTRIGRRLHLPHPHGIVLVVHSVIGDDCMIRHNVTVGAGSDTEGATRRSGTGCSSGRDPS
jgi:serine O-acetyltransferase